jgi:hypothetical protein
MNRPTSSLLRFGPGLVLAVVASVLLWPRLQPPAPVVADRTSPAAAIPRPPTAPDLDWVLGHRETLALTVAQQQKLSQLRTRWDRDSGPLRQALDQGSAEFRGRMASHPEGVSLEAVQQGSATVSDLSRRLAGLRRAYWAEASALLTPAQRHQAETQWSPLAAPIPEKKP